MASAKRASAPSGIGNSASSAASTSEESWSQQEREASKESEAARQEGCAKEKARSQKEVWEAEVTNSDGAVVVSSPVRLVIHCL